MTFYKTLFARMNNVKAQKFVDDETGESLNDVEKVLGELNISLRDSNGLFRNSGEVLDEVGQKWKTFDNVQQHAIATAFAGTRQQEKFIVLMQNYGKALEYANESATSAGTAQSKYDDAYLNSIEAKMNTLAASWQSFSQSLLDSDLVKFFVDVANAIVTVLEAIISFGDGAVVKFALIATSFVATIALINKGIEKWKKGAKEGTTAFWQFVQSIQKGTLKIGDAFKTFFASSGPIIIISTLITLFTTFSDKMGGWSLVIVGAILAIGTAVVATCATAKKAIYSFMASNPFGWILAAVTAVGLAITSVGKGLAKLADREEEAEKATLEAAKALREEADALKEVSDGVKEASGKIEGLVDEFKNLEKEANKAETLEFLKNLGESIGELYPNEELTSLQAINKLLETEYTYEDLINKCLVDRNGFLKDILKSQSSIALQEQKAAYEGYAAASDKLSERGTDYILPSDNRWDDMFGGGVVLTHKRAAETEVHRDITEQLGERAYSDPKGGLKADLEVMQAYVDAYREFYKYTPDALNNNDFYQAINEKLKTLQETYSAEESAANGILESVTKIHGFDLQINMNASDLETEYDKAVTSLEDAIRNDESLSEAFARGVISDDKISEYISDYMAQHYSELYNTVHVTARSIVEKSFTDMLNETQGQFDTLSDAMEEMAESGALSIDTVKTMTDQFPELVKYLKETAYGYELVEGSMGDFLGSIRTKYLTDIQNAQKDFEEVYAAYEAAVKEGTATEEDYAEVIAKQNTVGTAIKNFEGWQRVEATQTRSLLKQQYTDMLNKQTDELNKQADANKELCDIRRELLETYEEELKYQRELEKKTRNVAKLQAQLTVAQLDDSAAGRARVRELEAELKEAEEDLEDYTLEHAVDVLVEDINRADEEFQQFIKDEIEIIEESISAAAKMTSDAIAGAITSLGGDPSTGNYNKEAENGIISGALTAVGKLISDGFKPKDGGGGGGTPTIISGTIANRSDYKVHDINAVSWGNDNVTVEIPALGESYVTTVQDDAVDEATAKKLNALFETTPTKRGTMAVLDKQLYMLNYDRTWAKVTGGAVGQLTQKILEILNGDVKLYHTGGLVGNAATLNSNEEFAKLMKGEFVSTPAQMSRFMNHTLPGIAGASASNEFNAPLITIQCNSVTQDSLPSLKKIVKEAAKEVQKQLNEGMSRTGFKRQQKTLPI